MPTAGGAAAAPTSDAAHPAPRNSLARFVIRCRRGGWPMPTSLYEPAAKVSTEIDLDALLGANGTRTRHK